MSTKQHQIPDYWNECVRIRPYLVRIAARRCMSPVEPEDIVQEALIRGAEFERLDMTRVRPFLTRLVTRLCADEARHNAVVNRMAGHSRFLPQSTEDFADVVCDCAEARWLAARLENFSAKDRRLIIMLMSGFTYKEIADVLETTPQGAHTAVYRIRKKILQRYRG